MAVRRSGPSAAGSAAGGHGLPAAGGVRHQRAARRLAQRHHRPALRVQLDRRGARRRHRHLSVPGPRSQACARGDRPGAGAGRPHAWRGPARLSDDGHHAARPARGDRGRHYRVCRQSRPVRRHHHLRLERAGRDPHPAACDLLRDPDPRRRGGGGASGGAVDRAGACRPGPLRASPPAGSRHGAGNDARCPLHPQARRLRARCGVQHRRPRRHRPVRAVRIGQDRDRQRHCRHSETRHGPDPAQRHHLARHGGRHLGRDP